MVGEAFSTCRNQERLHGGGENDNYHSTLWTEASLGGEGRVKGERREKETGSPLIEVTPCVLSSWPFVLGVFLQLCLCVHAQSCPTFCNPLDCSPLGPSVHGISQARILEWVAISFSKGSY